MYNGIELDTGRRMEGINEGEGERGESEQCEGVTKRMGALGGELSEYTTLYAQVHRCTSTKVT